MNPGSGDGPEPRAGVPGTTVRSNSARSIAVLTGPTGTGKSEIALRLVREFADRIPIDVVYVALGVISWIYLLDAVAEAALILGHIVFRPGGSRRSA